MLAVRLFLAEVLSGEASPMRATGEYLETGGYISAICLVRRALSCGVVRQDLYFQTRSRNVQRSGYAVRDALLMDNSPPSKPGLLPPPLYDPSI